MLWCAVLCCAVLCCAVVSSVIICVLVSNLSILLIFSTTTNKEINTPKEPTIIYHQSNQPLTTNNEAMSNNSWINLASAALTGSIITLATIYLYSNTIKNKKNKNKLSSLNLSLSNNEEHMIPPLPTIVQSLLSNAHLAYLSTSDVPNETSHLSLMRFTYLPEDEVIVMSTRRDTKKFDLLRNQRGVAMLVHDFGSSPVEGTYSIALNGDCFIVDDDGDEKLLAERYRMKHLDHNPDYPQFIVGENIAILCVRVTSARICNINDKVQRWNIKDGCSSTSTEG